jgi:hypothetical protein
LPLSCGPHDVVVDARVHSGILGTPCQSALPKSRTMRHLDRPGELITSLKRLLGAICRQGDESSMLPPVHRPNYAEPRL